MTNLEFGKSRLRSAIDRANKAGLVSEVPALVTALMKLEQVPTAAEILEQIIERLKIVEAAVNVRRREAPVNGESYARLG